MHDFICALIALINEGWRPYAGNISPDVYARLRCPTGGAGKRRKKPAAYWMIRGDCYLCLGCPRRCSLVRPDGFQASLPLWYDTRRAPQMSPQEIMNKLRLLTPDQASYVLNVSRRQIYHWIAEGRLTACKWRPIRIPVESVRAALEDLDE